MSDTRIIAVTLAGRRPIQVFCTVTDTACHLAEIKYLSSNVKALNKHFVELEAKARKAKASLIIEDPTGFFLKYGRNLNLADKGLNGKPILVTAMTKYTAFEKIGAITFPSGDSSRFSIPQSIYNIKQSDSGAVGYEFNWESLRDEARAMLLCVYAGSCESVFQAGFYSKMMAAFNSKSQSKELRALEWVKDNELGVNVKSVML